MVRKPANGNTGSVYGYIRVSTDDQAKNGYGLEAQELSIRSFCVSQGLALTDIIRDEGESGSTMERPGLESLRKLLHSGAVSRIVVYKLDRLSRSLRDILNFINELMPLGCGLTSVMEPFIDTSNNNPFATMVTQMMGVFAEFERNLIRERLVTGRRQKAMKGGYIGGEAPLGYTVIGGELKPNRTKLIAVHRLLELRDMHPEWTLREVAEKLTKEGHSTAHGKRFTPMTIKRIIDRRTIYER